MKNKILSLLVLLLTAVTGAWAAPKFGVTEITPDMLPASWANDNSGFTRNFLPGLLNNLTVNDANPWSGMSSGDVFLIYRYTQSTGRYGYSKFSNGRETGGGAMGSKRELYYYVNNYKVYYATAYVEPDPNIIPVTPVAGQENQWEFDMPGSDVVLTPIYAEASILSRISEDEVTRTYYASLKEAFDNVQDGDIITLEWNVTVTNGTDLTTKDKAAPVKFIIDFNGFVLDGSSVNGSFIDTQHDGDEIRFIDTSEGQTGGLKGVVSGKTNSFVFESGRYNFGDLTAAEIKEIWSTAFVAFGYALPDGKEFVDIENAPDANGFMVCVGFKDIELTIGAGKFATLYTDQNVVLDDATPAGVGLYTITSINDDRSEATLAQLTGVIDGRHTPMLVYNGTDAELTVTLKVTDDDSNDNNPEPAEEFMGTVEDLEFTAADMAGNYDYYALSGGKVFAPVLDPGTLSAHQCYLEIPKQQAAGVRALTLVFDNGVATGLKAIDNEQWTIDNWYTIDGRKVATPTKKGIYIKSGKKVVVK